MLCRINLEKSVTKGAQHGLAAIDIERISTRREFTQLEEKYRSICGEHDPIPSYIPGTVELQAPMTGPIDPIQYKIDKGQAVDQPKRMSPLRATLANKKDRIVDIQRAPRDKVDHVFLVDEGPTHQHFCEVRIGLRARDPLKRVEIVQ
jgi:hypothetical protein